MLSKFVKIGSLSHHLENCIPFHSNLRGWAGLNLPAMIPFDRGPYRTSRVWGVGGGHSDFSWNNPKQSMILALICPRISGIRGGES